MKTLKLSSESLRQQLQKAGFAETDIHIIIKKIATWLEQKSLGVKPCKKVIQFKKELLEELTGVSP